MSVKSITCTVDGNLVLHPTTDQNSTGMVAVVQIVINEDAVQGNTGVINWSGCPQAFLTFDPTGRRVISYTMTSQDPAAVASVENILRVL